MSLVISVWAMTIPGRPEVAANEGATVVFGVLGVLAGIEEGLEINVLGLTFGVDPRQLSLKLPLAGTIGFGGAP